jgi:GNAT superfamily N-acetyltransferase
MKLATPRMDAITIEAVEGERARRAMRDLAPFHYRAGRPATVTRVLVARCAMLDVDVGVLVVSSPTLNAPWRRVAWPEAFAAQRGDGSGLEGGGMNKRDWAQACNRLVRTISRVIVDPRCRGLGVARSLVAAYLQDPQTPCTEALAAMAHWCPFFQSAGMREVEVPLAARHAALRDAMVVLGVEAWRLLDLREAAAQLRGRPELCCALDRWLASGRAGAALRRRTGVPREQMLALAASASLSRPMALVSP